MGKGELLETIERMKVDSNKNIIKHVFQELSEYDNNPSKDMKYLKEYTHKYVYQKLIQIPKKEIVHAQEMAQITKFETIFDGRPCTEADIVNLMWNRDIVYLRMNQFTT
jgi:reverse gyrase